jgi:hypothetical protein
LLLSIEEAIATAKDIATEVDNEESNPQLVIDTATTLVESLNGIPDVYSSAVTLVLLGSMLMVAGDMVIDAPGNLGVGIARCGMSAIYAANVLFNQKEEKSVALQGNNEVEAND